MTEEKYFNRQIQLWGTEKQHGLIDKKVAIIGSGGLGCTLAMALGTSGIGEIHIVDFDTVSLHNIHRQVAFTVDDVDKNKAKVTADLLGKKNPFLKIEAHDIDFDSFSKLDIDIDLILDATDNLNTRADIDRYAKSVDTPWIYASVEAFNGQVCFMDKSHFDIVNITDRKPAGIAAPMVMHIGSLQANIALRYLLGLPVVKDKLYYIYCDEDGDMVTQKFSMPKTE